MAVKLSPIFNDAQLDSSGNPLTGGKLYTYAAGSSTPQTAYQDSAGATPHTNPIVLNSRGEPPAPIWLTSALTYKFDLQTAASVSIRTVDNISGVNDTSVSLDQWVSSGLTPTYVSGTSFTLSGDQTSAFHIGRRLKTTNSGGAIYSTISNSVYGALTTVTVVNDSGVLDSGLSAVSYSILTNANPSLPSLQAAGDLLSLSAAGTLSRIAVGAAGTIPMSRAAATSKLAYVAALNKAIYGLTYANNVSDATNDLDIATGGAMDATGAYWMTLASALTKQSDANWAVGTNAGGLDTGAVGNSDYYIWLIARSDTGVVDVLYSLSSTAPTMPANYDFKRLIGWFKRTGGAIVAFNTYETEGGGLEFLWSSPTLDINLANTLTTSRRTDAVKVPLNFSVLAYMNVTVYDAGGNETAYIYCPDGADLAPSPTAAPLHTAGFLSTSSSGAGRNIWVRTSAAGLIAARGSTATVDLYAAATLGFRWARRN